MSFCTRQRQIDRRIFLKSIAAMTSATAATLESSGAEVGRQSGSLIDVNVSLSKWPLRELRGDYAPALVAKLRSHGVTQAWAGSFDGMLHKDIASVNARLAGDCRRYGRGLLVPFGSINPNLPDWEEELRRCAEEHHMPGIRLHPNYHGYTLDDPRFARLLALAVERRLLVQLALVMEDERMMHPLLRVAAVDVAPLGQVIARTRGLRLVLLNALRTLRGPSLRELLALGEVYVELGMLEGIGGLGKLVTEIPADRVLFGSHAPLFYFESALLKLKESPLTAEQLRAIRSENARRALNSKARPLRPAAPPAVTP